jgi:peroxiredoxin
LVLSSLGLANKVAAEDLKLGGAAPDWKDLVGTDDKPHGLADFQGKDAVVIVFTCNSCPYAQEAEDGLIALAKEFCGPDQKAALVAINANKVKEDLPAEMKKRAEKKGFNFPYVWDETQDTARAYGAKWTPEFYVFDRDRKLIYRGKLNDGSETKKPTVNYVVEAIKAALAGQQPKVQQTDPAGCLVRYERPKRK